MSQGEGTYLHLDIFGKFYRDNLPPIILSVAPGVTVPLKGPVMMRDEVAPVSIKQLYCLPPMVMLIMGSPSGPVLKGILRPVKIALKSACPSSSHMVCGFPVSGSDWSDLEISLYWGWGSLGKGTEGGFSWYRW